MCLKHTLFAERYEITQLTRDLEKFDGGRTNGYFYKILGTSGKTPEFECVVNRSRGANSTCSLKNYGYIGVYKGLSIRSSVENAWFCDKIYMKIDGVVQRKVETLTEVGRESTITVQVSGFDSVSKAL